MALTETKTKTKTKSPEPVKLFLHDRGTDVESVWAQPCGTAGGKPLYRLVNIPFLHAKPTWGDVLVAPKSREYGHPAWDRGGTPFAKVGTRIHTDGGRYAAIVDYRREPETNFGTLCRALWDELGVQAEGAWGPKGQAPGRLYLAVPKELGIDALLARLAREKGWRFTLVHPRAKTGGRASAAAKAKAGTAKTMPRAKAKAAAKATTGDAKKKAKPRAKAKRR
jgi:hypothetical protein